MTFLEVCAILVVPVLIIIYSVQQILSALIEWRNQDAVLEQRRKDELDG